MSGLPAATWQSRVLERHTTNGQGVCACAAYIVPYLSPWLFGAHSSSSSPDMSWKEMMHECATTTSIPRIVELAAHPRPEVRIAALKQVCPCRVWEFVGAFWDRVFDMVRDEDAAVRAQVLHTICDGSPAELEERVVEALEVFNRDPDTDIRRRAHKVLVSYRKTGKWNIL